MIFSSLDVSTICFFRLWFSSLRLQTSSRNFFWSSYQNIFSCSSLLLKPNRDVSSLLIQASINWLACYMFFSCSRALTFSINSLSYCFSFDIRDSLFFSYFTFFDIFSSCQANLFLARSNPSFTASSEIGEFNSFSSTYFLYAVSFSPLYVSSANRDSSVLHLSFSSINSLEQLSFSTADQFTILRSSTSFFRICASLEEISFMYFSNSFQRTLFLQVSTSTLFFISLNPRQYSFSSDLLSFSILMQDSYLSFSSLYSTFHLFSSFRRVETYVYYLLLELGDIYRSFALYFLGERASTLALN